MSVGRGYVQGERFLVFHHSRAISLCQLYRFLPCQMLDVKTYGQHTCQTVFHPPRPGANPFGSALVVPAFLQIPCY